MAFQDVWMAGSMAGHAGGWRRCAHWRVNRRTGGGLPRKIETEAKEQRFLGWFLERKEGWRQVNPDQWNTPGMFFASYVFLHFWMLFCLVSLLIFYVIHASMLLALTLFRWYFILFFLKNWWGSLHHIHYKAFRIIFRTFALDMLEFLFFLSSHTQPIDLCEMKLGSIVCTCSVLLFLLRFPFCLWYFWSWVPWLGWLSGLGYSWESSSSEFSRDIVLLSIRGSSNL